MKTLRVYNIVNENGQAWLGDITVQMQDDFSWTEVFDEVEKALSESVESYSYEEIVAQNNRAINSMVRVAVF